MIFCIFFVARYIAANLLEPVFPPQSPPTLGIGLPEFLILGWVVFLFVGMCICICVADFGSMF